MKSIRPIITLLGPTATGKTRIATLLAAEIAGEIVSADSRQVYRNMDIGTGKDLGEYKLPHASIPYHMIDIVAPGTEYNIFQYQQQAIPIIAEIQSRNKTVILCGGSGLYIEALLKGYKLFPAPKNNSLRGELALKSEAELTKLLSSFKRLHNKTDTENRDRLYRAIEIEYYYQEHPELQIIAQAIPSLLFGLKGDRDFIRQRITSRLKKRLENGMIEEVESLIKAGVDPHQLIRYGLEYKFITLYLSGEINYETLFNKLNIAIHQFSKRQMTWFRKMEKDGFHIHWLDLSLPEEEKIIIMKQKIQQYYHART